MPYIKEERRKEINENPFRVSNSGELNYLFYKHALAYFQDLGANYKAINDVMGAFEGAKNEFYHRVAVPYEEVKIKENGDVVV